jgi:hypothetical protein
MSVPEQQAEGLVLLHEAKEKLTGWRREAVVALLDKGNVGAEVLQRAMRIRDESSDNEFRRLALGREQIGTAVLVLGLALAAFLPLELVLPVGLSLKPEAAPTRIWAFVFLFGVIGGCISVLQSGAAARGRVPLLLGHTLITAARPLTGGAAALVSYALFGAGVFGGAKVDSVAAVLGIAFAAGFSERIVIKTAQALAGDGAPADGGGSRSPKR